MTKKPKPSPTKLPIGFLQPHPVKRVCSTCGKKHRCREMR